VTATWSEHPEARAEFLDAVAYLADRHLGLVDELIDRVESAIEDVVEMPASWPPVPYWDEEPRLRSRAVKPFRYHIVYYVVADAVRVIAYAHESQEPGYWQRRLGDEGFT